MSRLVGLGCALSFSILTAACGGAIDTTAPDEAETTAWSAMLTCEDGGAVLEVDRADARHVQLVVRHDEASSHLRTRVERAANDLGEIVVSGNARLPIEGAQTFDRFVDESGRFDRAPASLAPADRGNAASRIVAEVRRGAVDEVTLSFQEVTTTRSCTGTIEERFCRGGEWVESRAIEELAAWRFTGCR